MVSSTRVFIICIALVSTITASAQERFSFFHPSTPESVERMLKLANQRIAYATVLDQQFQAAEGVVRAGANREVLSDMKLNGENISFSIAVTLEGIGLTRHEFTGKVRGERIEGAVQLVLPEGTRLELPWHASRTTASDYFAPTGINMP